MIGIINYGAGNLLSVKKAFDYLSLENKIISGEEDFKDIDKLVLPGVGAFGSAVDRLQSVKLWDLIIEWLNNDMPFLGICLGLQLLYEKSEENLGVDGFGFLRGNVKRFQKGKIPQIGWNSISIKSTNELFYNIDNNSFFYFVHGYYVDNIDDEVEIAITDYYITYTSAIQKGNIVAVQFHPEKSGKKGLQFLLNWSKLC